MMDTSQPPPSASPAPTPSPPPPVVQVPPAPAPSTLTFFVRLTNVRRNDLNELAAEENSVVHLLMTLGIGFDKRIYTTWKVDAASGSLVLAGPHGQQVRVPLRDLTIEEMAALRFLIATHPETSRQSDGWRAHVLEQLGAMVPIFDFNGGEIDVAKAAALFRSQAIDN